MSAAVRDGWFWPFWVFLLNWPHRTYQMTAFHEQYPPPHFGQGVNLIIAMRLILLKRNWPASLKIDRAQQPSHNTGMKASVLMPVLALFHMDLLSVQTHVGGVAVVSWHFPRVLHFIIEYVSYARTHTHKKTISCMVAYVCLQALGWLSQVFLATNCSRPNNTCRGPSCI